MALTSLSFKKIYKPTNNNLRTSRANQDNSPRTNKGIGYDNQRAINVAGARENVGTPIVQKSGIQSKGRTVADSIAERLTRPTAYEFKTDCSIIPVW
ncbi:hypothetical protein Tco_0106863, partial [Tanacetum coccineum]